MKPAHALRATLRASALALWFAAAPAADATKYAPTLQDLLAASTPADWRALDPDNTLYLELATGRVVIELAPAFAPLHAANIRALARAGYYDGLAIIRVQDNFVVQWGDADGKRELKGEARTLAPEFTRADSPDLGFAPLPDRDGYAPEVGFASGLPAARDPRRIRPGWRTAMAWSAPAATTTSPAAVAPNSTSSSATRRASSIATSPWSGASYRAWSCCPRCRAAAARWGSTTSPSSACRSPRCASRPTCRRRTQRPRGPAHGHAVLQKAGRSRRNRGGDWYQVPAGHIDLCNVPLPVRQHAAGAAEPCSEQGE